MNVDAFQGDEHQPFWNQPTLAHGGALLVHGFPGSPAEMRGIATVLRERGWATRGILLPGFGPEIEKITEKKHTDWEKAVNQALNDLRQDYETVILVGNSMGGALSIQAAAHNAVDGLILFAPFWTVDNILWKVLPILKYVIPHFKPFKLFEPDFSDPEFQKGTRNFMPNADFDDPEFQRRTRELEIQTNVFAQIRNVGVAAYQLAPQVKVPTFVVQGANDELVTPDNTQKLIRRFSAPYEYIEIDAQHNLLDDNYSDDWNYIVRHLQAFIEPLEMSSP